MSAPIDMQVSGGVSIDMRPGGEALHYVTEAELRAILAEYVTSGTLEQILANYPTKTEVDEDSIVRWKQGQNEEEEE